VGNPYCIDQNRFAASLLTDTRVIAKILEICSTKEEMPGSGDVSGDLDL
jgi:hypothetical protein